MGFTNAILSVAFLLGSVNAFSTSTGSCDAGTGAILKEGFSHATNAQVGTGPLSDAGITVTLNDTALVPDTPTDISTTESYNLTIASDNTTFTGFLARIEGSGDDPFLDTTAALAPYDNLAQVAVGTCVLVHRVGGVSHTNADPKSSVSTELKMEMPANGLLLDITVVLRNKDALNVSEWYFSRYELNAVGSPTVAPTPMMFPGQQPTAATDNGDGAPTSDAIVVRMAGAAVLTIGAMIMMI